MINRHKLVLGIFALLLVAGCASTEIYNNQKMVSGPIPRPAHVWVYDFGATPEDVPADSALAGQYSQDAAYQNKEQIETGRKLGALIATELVKQIRDMGMPAEHAVTGTVMQINDIILRGYLISYDEGNATKRVMIGFGSGSSNVKVTLESFQVTTYGLLKLGSGSASAGASKTPGAAVGAAAFIATANPVGLIVGTGVKVYGEKSGKSKVEGRADQLAKEIADVLKERFKEQGWIK